MTLTPSLEGEVVEVDTKGGEGTKELSDSWSNIGNELGEEVIQTYSSVGVSSMKAKEDVEVPSRSKDSKALKGFED